MAEQPLALQIQYPTPGKDPIDELRRITSDNNRILVILQGKIDALEARLAALEKQV